MQTKSTKTFRENRARYSLKDLRPFEGKWVAFSADAQRIVASAPSITELANEVQAAGEDLQDVVLEWVEFDAPDTNLGGAEFE
jgi:hypothetical protein